MPPAAHPQPPPHYYNRSDIESAGAPASRSPARTRASSHQSRTQRFQQQQQQQQQQPNNYYQNPIATLPPTPTSAHTAGDDYTDITMETADQYYTGGRSNTNKSRSGNNVKKSSFWNPFRNKSEEQAIIYSNLPTRTRGGTFAGTTTAAGGISPIDTDNHSNNAYPRSQEHLQEKWGKLNQQVDTHKLLAKMERQNRADANGGMFEESLQGNSDNMTDAQRRKQAQDAIKNRMTYGITAALLAIAIYVGISIGTFSFWLEHWTIVDSIYFALVTFTTIGYGDLAPDTTASRIFTCVWALSGVACLGIALGVLGSQLIDVAEQEQKKAKKKQREEVIDMFNNEESEAGNNTYNSKNTGVPTADETSQWSGLGPYGAEDYDNDDDDDEENSKSGCCGCSRKTRRFVLLFIIMGGLLAGMAHVENWYPWTALYYGLITASTVGYGDLAPATQTGRILAICYIPVAVGVIGTFLDAIADAIIERKRKATERYLENKELTLNDLKVMDANGDGQVTMAEFYEFMLVAMDQVDRDTMDHLKQHFQKLDADNSGTLDKEDLVKMAENKIGSSYPAKSKKTRELEQELMSRGSSVLAYKNYNSTAPRW